MGAKQMDECLSLGVQICVLHVLFVMYRIWIMWGCYLKAVVGLREVF